jgi:hypothetical protein
MVVARDLSTSHNVRPFRGPVGDPKSGRLSIVTGYVFNDTRLGSAHREMLGVLGTHADVKTGWCHPKQSTLARRLGISQPAVSQRIAKLAQCGYLEIHDRFNPATGARKPSEYRLVMDYQLPAEFDRLAGVPDDETEEIDTPISSPNGGYSLSLGGPLADLMTPISPANNYSGRPIRTTHPDDKQIPEGSVVAPAPGEAALAIVLPFLDAGDELAAPTVVPEPSGKSRRPAKPRRECADETCTLRVKGKYHGVTPGLTDDADVVMLAWEHAQGETRPGFNPTQLRLMNADVADMGVDHMIDSAVWAAGKGIREVDKFRSGAKTKAGKNPQRQGGDRAHFLDSRQPHRAALYQNRPGSTGKPGDKISPDIARTDETWDTPWWNIPGLPDLPDDDAQQDQP